MHYCRLNSGGLILLQTKRDQMRVFQTILLPSAFIAFVSFSCIKETTEEVQRPNILLIVADDLGYSDIQPYGGEIQTPTLSRLADEGMKFSNFHVLPTCSPTRSALLSGNDNHVAGLGVMDVFIYEDIENLPGYVGHLNDQVAILPEILSDAGYNTYMSGKWHLGEDDTQSPYARGFDETFTMMAGGGSHWADMRGLNPEGAMIYRYNGERIQELPNDFYSTKNYTDSLIQFIDRNKADDKPFFGYLSFTAPHDPLHAPEEYIEKYKGKYDAGWDELRLKRLQALKDVGLIAPEVNEFPANFMVEEWDSLSDEEKKEYSRDMEVYAAMVDYVDMSIGRLFNYLKVKGLYENTLIVFMSDNGANGASATAYPGNLNGKYLSTFNNEYQNRGLPNSFIDMGAGWARASSAPMRMFKSFTSEGGIRSPLIVKAPKQKEGVPAWNDGFLHVTDLMPTFLEYAQVDYPETVNDKVVKRPIGKSMIPVFKGTVADIHEDGGMGYELFEMKAFIRGNWKILRMPEPFGSGEWELFDLKSDPGEIHDLSMEYPELKKELMEAWEAYSERNEVFDHKGRFDAIYRQLYGVE
jgi:arylsulfatase